MQEHKNLLIAILACITLWLGVELWLKPTPSVVAPSNEQICTVPPVTPKCIPRQEALSTSARVPIDTPYVQGSLSLKGAFLDDWTLRTYHETWESRSPSVHLLSPGNSEHGYYGTFRWIAPDSGIELPGDDTLWEADGNVLSPKNPVTLSWRNASGILFQLLFSIDDAYGLTITHKVTHVEGGAPLTLRTQSVVRRQGPVKTSGYFMLHEGLLRFSERLEEYGYADVLKKKAPAFQNLMGGTKGVGWTGITDKYWLVSLIPGEGIATEGGIQSSEVPLRYQVETVTKPVTVQPGETKSALTHLFAGPKRLSLLDGYEHRWNINHFDLAVDFGWFYFLTKPMFLLLSWLKDVGGSFGFAILVMTVFIKMAFFPLSLKSYRSMARMRKLQPMLESLKSRYPDDKVKLNQEMMALYRKEKVNPASGCLPMLAQFPIFFALYKVLFISIEMRQAPFWGWIHDLSAPDPTNLFTAFGLFPWATPSWLCLGAWPLIMGGTMILQQRMNTSMPLDAHQKFMMMYVMPSVFMFMLAQFPVGLVIYWTWSNVLTVLQQAVMTRYYSEAI
jgi:YidC/Oxa1 family membrane protein insertase